MKLIRENIEEVKYLTEATENGKKNLYITGPFLVYDKPNKNNRMYTKDILSNEVKRYNEEYVKTNRALGELGHPDTPSINLERVSHKIVELTDNGEAFIGKALILDTPYGQIVKNFMEWLFVEGRFVEVDFDNAKKQIKQASRKDIEQVAFNLFENFIRKL